MTTEKRTHYGEPWFTSGVAEIGYSDLPGFRPNGHWQMPGTNMETRFRIVECVNAMAGISDPGHVLRILLKACKAAEEEIAAWENADDENAPTAALLEQLRNAIALAGGKDGGE